MLTPTELFRTSRVFAASLDPPHVLSGLQLLHLEGLAQRAEFRLIEMRPSLRLDLEPTQRFVLNYGHRKSPGK
jgi:hypothetical protein